MCGQTDECILKTKMHFQRYMMCIFAYFLVIILNVRNEWAFNYFTETIAVIQSRKYFLKLCALRNFCM